jgi:iron-chelate-transporting ATPase
MERSATSRGPPSRLRVAHHALLGSLSMRLIGEDLELAYHSTTVVHGVSLELRPGHVVALLGPNGSGKSTVLRGLARLHRVSGGRVAVERGDDLVDASLLGARDFARHVTMLSQSRPHPSGLVVHDIVAFGRHPHRRRFAALDDADRAAIDRALALTGLHDMTDRSVDQLSGGELQRVWLATCLAQDTGVLLLDEPTNHLDLRFQVEILDLVRTLADDHDTAIGIVLHDLNQAASVADEVVLLDRGRVRAAGAPDAVLTGPVLSEVYGLPIQATVDPDSGIVRVEPKRASRQRRPLTSNP